MFIAIGGGGFIPARILRTQLKNDVNGKKRNIPIQAVGLVLYEDMGGVSKFFLLFFPVKVWRLGNERGQKRFGVMGQSRRNRRDLLLAPHFYLFSPFLWPPAHVSFIFYFPKHLTNPPPPFFPNL